MATKTKKNPALEKLLEEWYLNPNNNLTQEQKVEAHTYLIEYVLQLDNKKLTENQRKIVHIWCANPSVTDEDRLSILGVERYNIWKKTYGATIDSAKAKQQEQQEESSQGSKDEGEANTTFKAKVDVEFDDEKKEEEQKQEEEEMSAEETKKEEQKQEEQQKEQQQQKQQEQKKEEEGSILKDITGMASKFFDSTIGKVATTVAVGYGGYKVGNYIKDNFGGSKEPAFEDQSGDEEFASAGAEMGSQWSNFMGPMDM